ATLGGSAFTTSGLANGDTVTSVTLTSSGAAATAAVSGSPYTIVPSVAVGTGLGNYIIGYVNGTLTVNAAALTITANNRSKTYGQAVNAVSPNVTGLVNGDTVTVAMFSTGAGATAAVGGYAIVPSGAVFGVGVASNYSIAYVNGTLTVN